jgi:hypothetical protein
VRGRGRQGPARGRSEEERKAGLQDVQHEVKLEVQRWLATVPRHTAHSRTHAASARLQELRGIPASDPSPHPSQKQPPALVKAGLAEYPQEERRFPPGRDRCAKSTPGHEFLAPKSPLRFSPRRVRDRRGDRSL